jgi:hypothetical protein
MSNLVINDIIVNMDECDESYPCEHHVKCEKLGIDGSMNSTEICKLFKAHGLEQYIDPHLLDNDEEDE